MRATTRTRWSCCGLALAMFAVPALAVPPNDNCEDQIPITDGATDFDTTGANTDGPSHASCEFDGQTYHDIWYTYEASCTGNLTVSTCSTASYDTDLVVYDGCDCGALELLGCNDDGPGCTGYTSEVTVPVTQSSCYLIRIGGWSSADEGSGTVHISCAEPGDGACCFGEDTCVQRTEAECDAGGGNFMGEGVSCTPNPCGASSGADVIYSDCQSISNYGQIGGIRGYALGSHTCNIGTVDLLWINNGTPGLAMNAYRLHQGRLEQIGMSWVKHACCAAAGNGCGLSCNGHGGNVLGAGCLDVYSAGWNGSQTRLGARSGINPFNGAFQGPSGGSGNAVYKRLQIAESDMTQIGTLYFIEGIYVGTDDVQGGNAYNNASYKRATVGGSYNLNAVGAMNVGVPAINAWHDHGNGVGNPDESVHVVNLDVPDEGRFVVASKVTELGGDSWRYDYAIFNINSHRSGGSFTVPIPPGVSVTNVGFHDVPYHSGEPYDNTDWTSTVTADSVRWASPHTFDEDPNSNALRWGTMYNFWFDASAGSGDVEASLGLFRPYMPDSLAIVLPGPTTGIGDIEIVGSVPPNGAIDARHTSEPEGGQPLGWSEVLLMFDDDTTGLTPDDFTISVDPPGTPPMLAFVFPNGNTATLQFGDFAPDPFPAGHWTTITHNASGTSTRLGYLPADANNDRLSNANDVLALINALNDVGDPLAEYQTDVDRSGVTNASDILRAIDLLNGAGVYSVWLGQTLPD